MTEQTSASDSGLFDVELALRQARAYLAFGEQARLFADHLHETMQGETDWSKALHEHFAKLKSAIAASADDPKINPELARLWLLIANLWGEAAASLGATAEAIPEEVRESEAWWSYQRVQTDYLEQLRKSAMEALDLMEQKLSEFTAAGKTLSSLRELYNLWVDCNEETYARMLRSSAYGEMNGRLINTLLRCCARQDSPT